MSQVLNYIISPAFIGSVIVVIIILVSLSFIKKYLIKKVAYTNKDEQHKNTLAGVIFNVLQYLIIIVGVVIIFKINGVNITSIVAGLGIMATIVGLSLQDTLKDIFAGINIYSNNFYKVGDAVVYDGELCEVKYFNARVTKFKKQKDGATFTVCNNTITSIEKVKGEIVAVYTFDPSENPEKIKKVFDEITKEVEAVYGLSKAGAIDVRIVEKGLICGVYCHCNPRDTFGSKIKVETIATNHILSAKLKVVYSNNNITVTNK